MAISKITAEFSVNIEKVWDTVTSLEDYAWRSDLSRIEIQSEKQFAEYTKEGYVTNFTITALEPYERYEFDMENDNMKGHWTGNFACENGVTIIEFTEDVTVKKLVMKPFVGMYLKKQQMTYIEDLKRVLEDFE